jgi:hypothetical protein
MKTAQSYRDSRSESLQTEAPKPSAQLYAIIRRFSKIIFKTILGG